MCSTQFQRIASPRVRNFVFFGLCVTAPPEPTASTFRALALALALSYA